MKVLQVNAVNAIGSTGRSVSELAAALERRGIESPIAYSAGPAPRNGFRIGNAIDHKAHALWSRVFGMQAYFSHGATQRLLAYIRRESPDIVHLRNVHANYVNLPVLLRFLAEQDIATVVTLHDCWYFTGRCCHYTVDVCDRWLCGCGRCPRLAKDNPSWFLDRSTRMWADKKRLFGGIPRLGVIGVSDWITGEAERSLLAKASIVRRIYNWVDLDVFSPAAVASRGRFPGLEGRFVMLGVASGWSHAKGLGDFIRLGEMLCAATDSSAIRSGAGQLVQPAVVLVGSVPNGVRLPNSVHTVGGTDEVRRLVRYYAAADVLLQLSREESFGKVVAEALSVGTPVIAYDSTANPELVGPGCGYVASPGDLDQVMARGKEIAARGAASYEASCRAFAERSFGMEERVDEHVALYEELVRKRRSVLA